ncbi:MAG: VOC family protein [Saprospiraceae bacterium]|nr:VOC family protein [Candidatus Brachybacter algidus]MBK8748531.1 VOC family protein [Candidatus Brachybacter algidus]
MNSNQVTLPASDLKKSITFYELLGLKLIVKALPYYARFECPQGDSTFSLHQVNGIKENNNSWIYFELEQLDQKVAELISLGIQIEEMPEDKSWLWREARLKDLDGNQLILYYAGENRKDPPWKLVGDG